MRRGSPLHSFERISLIVIFAVSPGSEGLGPERHVAYVPFVIAPGATLNALSDPVALIVGPTALKLEKLQLLYSLTLGPFQSEAEATRALAKLGAALLWSSLFLGIGIRYAHLRGDVTFLDAPQLIPDSEPMAHIGRVTGWEATDGHYEAEHAIVRPDHKRLTRWEMGQATMTRGISSERLLASLEQALAFPKLDGVVANTKLTLATELYAGHLFELSENAQFISLVTALEALLPDVPIAQSAVVVLNQAIELILAARKQLAPNSPEWSDIDRLMSRVSKLKYEAIGTSLRRFADSVVQRNPELGEADAISEGLRKAYSVRSRLLHDGVSEQSVMRTHLNFLKTFVPGLLKVLFEEESGARGMSTVGNAL